MVQMGTGASLLLPELRTPEGALPYAVQYRKPPAVVLRGAEMSTSEAGDFNADGFNESEGCLVLRSKGPVELTYRKGDAAGFAPVFKIIGWQGTAPTKIKADGKEVPVIADVVGGRLILQVLSTLTTSPVKLEIGR
jgi:hypothetical protein